MGYCIILFIIAALVGLRYFIFRHQLRLHVGWTRSKRGRNNGYIYFFRGRREAIWQVKIGRTNNLRNRLRSHRTANPFGIELLAAFRTSDDVRAEAILHKMFAQNRISSRNEWFHLSLDLWLAMHLLRDQSLTERIQSWLNL